MNQKNTNFHKILSILLVTIAMSFPLFAQGIHILNTNGSFENTTPGVKTGTDIKGWLIQVAAVTPAPEFSVTDTTAQDGKNSLQVKVSGVGTNPWDIQIVADSIPVKSNHTYKFSIWAKADKAGAQASITIGNYSYSEYGAISPRPAPLTTEWKEYTMQFKVTDNQKFIRGPIHFSFKADSGKTIFFDNLKIFDIADFDNPVVIQAESGQLGSDFEVKTDPDSTKFVTITTPQVKGGNPGNVNRMITYQVTFADTGTYNFFARVRVGAGAYNDDSFFYGNGFGTKDTIDSNWITVNGLAAAGFADSTDIVDAPGGLGAGVWKWVNLSKNGLQSGQKTTFVVKKDSLTQTFQIGAREDGLDIDKIAFGKASLFYSVSNLDKGEAGSPELPGEKWPGPPLASKQPKFVGSAYSSPQVQDFEKYWNEVIPENAGKWGSVEGTKDVMNWGGLDEAYNFAKTNKFPFNFHVLIWGAQQPAWISNLTPDEQLTQIRQWFQAVADRYPDIDYLQVVNEPLLGHNPPDGTNGRANYKAALGGDGTTGWDWVINAFKMAREIFPAKTKLMINDFNIINSSSATATYLKIIRLLKAQNLIDVICEQGHAFTTTATNRIMKTNLDSLASTGLPIQITEMDIDGTDDNVQLASYKRIFPLLYQHPAVQGITLWGWRPGLWRDTEGAYIIKSSGVERPALKWLRSYLDSVNVTTGVETAGNTLPKTFQLFNNYPNPFNPTTQIRYDIPQASEVTLKIYDIMGREVQTLVNQVQSPGQYVVSFNARNLSSGVYFYQLKAGSFTKINKMMLMK